jgi:succinate-semialdehyde dehydrogenase / glutarate-semialdehyde dehydrogenase
VAPVRVVADFDAALAEAAHDRYGLAATVLTPDMGRAQHAWRTLPVGTVKINAVFGGAPGGASEPRGDSGSGFGFGPELLDEMTAMKVVHWSAPASADR